MAECNRSALPLHSMSVREIAALVNAAGYSVDASIDTYHVRITLQPMRDGGALYPTFSYSVQVQQSHDSLRRYQSALAYLAGRLFAFQESEGLV